MVETEEKPGLLEVITAPAVEKRIFVVRGRQVMLDEDLADLYGETTKRLVQQVKRNSKRFPEDFMFQLNKAEVENLRSQIATSSDGHGGRRYAPYVFTEQGIAMLSGVLRGDRAIAVNIEIMRAFVELRRVAVSYAALQERLDDLLSGRRGRWDSGSAKKMDRYDRRRLQTKNMVPLRRSRAPNSEISLEDLFHGADRIRAKQALSTHKSTAAELIREDRDR